jgi:hypothetical protein
MSENTLDCVMFVPACGLGTRVAERGAKPFLYLSDNPSAAALRRVIAQAPDWMPIEIALPSHMGCCILDRDATVHFFKEQTRGQAHTIYKWMEKSDLKHKWTLISNCDNEIDRDSIDGAIYTITNYISVNRCLNGVVFTFEPTKHPDDRFSYVQSSKGRITHIAEKQSISTQACAGVYLLRTSALDRAIQPDDNYLSQTLARMQELYVWPVKTYRGWNDMAQIMEVETYVKQHR